MNDDLSIENGTISINYYVVDVYEDNEACDIGYFTTFSEAKKFLIAWLLKDQKITMDDLYFFDVEDGDYLAVQIGNDSSCEWHVSQEKKTIYASASEAEFMRED